MALHGLGVLRRSLQGLGSLWGVVPHAVTILPSAWVCFPEPMFLWLLLGSCSSENREAYFQCRHVKRNESKSTGTVWMPSEKQKAFSFLSYLGFTCWYWHLNFKICWFLIWLIEFWSTVPGYLQEHLLSTERSLQEWKPTNPFVPNTSLFWGMFSQEKCSFFTCQI